jgi:2-keto-4-pentenoate hydratase
MAQDRIAAAAAAVAENRLAGRRLGRLAGLETLEDGYAAQQEANRALEQRLGARVGHKIGGTTAPMRAYINVPEPIGGEVFASTVHASGTVLPLGSFVRPGVETEIAVRLKHGLPPREQAYGRDEVTAATEAVMAAIEIVDDRYEDFRTIGAQTLLADNAFNAGSLLGEPTRDFNALDLGALRARTLIDGQEVASGLTDALLGHPMDALAWLANRRSKLGLGLAAGTFVSLGSITPVQWVVKPAAFRVEVEALGAVEVAFA